MVRDPPRRSLPRFLSIAVTKLCQSKIDPTDCPIEPNCAVLELHNNQRLACRVMERTDVRELRLTANCSHRAKPPTADAQHA